MHELLKCGPQFENENMKIDHFLLLQEGGRGDFKTQDRSVVSVTRCWIKKAPYMFLKVA